MIKDQINICNVEWCYSKNDGESIYCVRHHRQSKEDQGIRLTIYN